MKSHITKLGFAIYLEILFLLPVFSAEAGYFETFDYNHKAAYRLYQTDLQYNRSIDSMAAASEGTFDFQGIDQFRFNYVDSHGINHVVYGDPNSATTSSVLDFSFDSLNAISGISRFMQDSALGKICAGLIRANDSVITNAEKKKITLSPYIIFSKDTIKIYYMPSFQLNGLILFSTDYLFEYKYDKSSSKVEFILKKEEPAETRKYDPKESKEIVLDISGEDVPTVESLFFMHIYFPYFGKIIASTKQKETYLVDIKSGNYVHLNKNN